MESCGGLLQPELHIKHPGRSVVQYKGLKKQQKIPLRELAILKAELKSIFP
jgi:hypothetical protein